LAWLKFENSILRFLHLEELKEEVKDIDNMTETEMLARYDQLGAELLTRVSETRKKVISEEQEKLRRRLEHLSSLH